MDWSWGIWEMNGAFDQVEFSSSRIISAADFDRISRGSRLYTLSGMGAAAAAITHDGVKRLGEGECSLNVQVGQSVLPNWDGSFSMHNAKEDSLSFNAEGAIQGNGTLTGSQTSYSMMADGVRFNRGSLTDERIEGHLVGPGTGQTPISGAIGDFTFQHGNRAQVVGGFGADLGR